MSEENDLGQSLRRVRVLTALTVREAVRRRIFVLALVLALGLVLALQALRVLNFGASELRFFTDVGFGAISFFGAMLTVVLSTQLFFGDLETGAARTVLAKPVGRGEFVAGKLIGVWLVTCLFCLVGTLLLGGQLWWREAALAVTDGEVAGGLTHGVDYGALAIAGGAQALKLAILAGYVVLVATYASSSLLATGVGLVVWLAGNLQPLVVEFAQRGTSWTAVWGGRIVAGVVPDLQRFDLGERVVSGSGVPVAEVGWLVAYAGSYAVVTLGLAMWSFRHREL